MKTTTLDTKPVRIGRAQVSLLEKLSNAIGVSGCEDEVRKIVLEEIKPLTGDVKVDAMGNILAMKHATKKNPMRVLLAAHMDEVGFMIVDDEHDGIFAIDPVGGIDPRQLVAKSVLVGKDRVPGVIGGKPIHLTSAEERHNIEPLSSLRIDVSPANAGKVKVGDFATFATTFQKNGTSLFGKALDDRLGVATLIELMKLEYRNLEILFAFTVQEEIGLRGAHVVGFDFKPDLAFAIDSTPAFDFSFGENENTQYNCRLGAGPAIYLADAGTLSDPRLIRFLVSVAERQQIPYQFRQPGGGGTDAGSIHKTGSGIPTVSISVPGRYAHSPVLHAKVQDWQAELALLDAALNNLDRSILSVDR